MRLAETTRSQETEEMGSRAQGERLAFNRHADTSHLLMGGKRRQAKFQVDFYICWWGDYGFPQ